MFGNPSASLPSFFALPLSTWRIPTVAIFFLILLPTVLLWLTFRASSDDLEKMSFGSTWKFMSRRHDFVTRHLKQKGGRPVSFRILNYTVAAFAGERSRRQIFAEPNLDPIAAQRVFGVLPGFKEPAPEEQVEMEAQFARSFLRLMHRDRLSEALPSLLEDTSRLAQRWGSTGTFEPFVEMYDLSFQMALRISTCRDIFENRKAVLDLQKSFHSLGKNATPFSTLFPWFPGPAQLGRLRAVMSIIQTFRKAAQRRRGASDSGTDGIDVLISQGDDDETISGKLLGFMLASTVNTGVMAAWSLIYLGFHPQWKQRATSELRKLVEKYCDNLTDEPLHKQLAPVPLKAWEDEIPFLDLIIRETIRLIMCGVAMRRNLGHEVVVDGVKIAKGDFAVYSIADAHLNPDIYTNPTEFDPERYLPGREEDQKAAFAYIGWGAGRHICLGMKLAILELKVLLALMLLGFEWELVDPAGSPLEAIPLPDRNGHHTVQPLGDPCYVKFTRIKELS